MTLASILQVFHLLTEKKESGKMWPVKCVFLLLKRLFYGVDHTESSDINTNTFTSNVCVSYDFEFSYTSTLSQIDAKNHSSLKALQRLCEIENKFVQRIRNDIFPPNFAAEIQKYD